MLELESFTCRNPKQNAIELFLMFNHQHISICLPSMGHLRGFESGWITRREEATIGRGADSFSREGWVGRNLGREQGRSNNNSGGGTGQGGAITIVVEEMSGLE
jgi:hypothetical protein